ncbi:Carbohydrate sulfotransferase 15 [Holothuria leucospilota]|uniref:Carbohydrate sulfotransferase 15 n=1 Tax=Holothuria leucospilota TaxID=206669 RepID=A0A9Q1HDA3_HOLLE|nr:Carbohydrate sulfotransferase 15 [Holothuria leucospilota]
MLRHEELCPKTEAMLFFFASSLVFVMCYKLLWNDNHLTFKTPVAHLTSEKLSLRFRPERVVLPSNTSSNPTIPSSDTNSSAVSEKIPVSVWKPYVKELFDRFPENFSSRYLNPCWEEGTTLRCVPYFYQIGSFKCGTTDLWDKIVQHPQVVTVAKEPHWWAWRRFGFKDTPIHRQLVLKIRRITGNEDDHALQWYLNLFSHEATTRIQSNPRLVIGDASISTLWGLGDYEWEQHFPDKRNPPFFLADVLHALQPTAKITVILRDPVEKLWTTYLLDQWKRHLTPKKFHFHWQMLHKESVQCESLNTPTYCAFMHGSTADLSLKNYLYQGIYYLYLKEWVNAYGLENIHVLRLEDWKATPIAELASVIKYLELDPLPMKTLKAITNRATQNVNVRAKKRNITMFTSTRTELQNFYRPWNKKLAELLKDPKYLWDY